VWDETPSEHFVARHEDRDAGDAEGVLELLEATRARLARAFAVVPAGVDVVLHGSDAQLLLARPGVALERLVAAPAARRYVTGTWSKRELHVLAPRRLEERASTVPGSRELVLLSPAGLYSRLVVGSSSRALRSRRRSRRLAWLAWGAAEWFSGQTAHARPAIARRLREGRSPAFPPGRRDARLLGGTVVDLLVRERGEAEAVRLVDEGVLRHAFLGAPLREIESRWREHLERLVRASEASG
jgi:hypothetical protein